MAPGDALHAVFDLDGTLIDSVGLCTTILNAMLFERGSSVVLTTQQARPHITFGGIKMVEALLGDQCGDPDLEIAEFRARYRAIQTSSSSLFPGVRAGLQTLTREGVRLAVCSNKPQALCEKILADLELTHLFDAVVGSEPASPLKPDPALYDKALQIAGGRRERSCYVGDTEVDHALAQRVRAPFILVKYGYAERDARFEGALYADDFSEVPQRVRQAFSGMGLAATPRSAVPSA